MTLKRVIFTGSLGEPLTKGHLVQVMKQGFLGQRWHHTVGFGFIDKKITQSLPGFYFKLTEYLGKRITCG